MDAILNHLHSQDVRLWNLEEFKVSVQSRQMLKLFAKEKVELRRSNASPYLKLNITRGSKKYSEYVETRTFKEILDPLNVLAHVTDLKTDYQQLINPTVMSCREDDILLMNPKYADSFRQLPHKAKITVLLGFPENRIRRAVESQNGTCHLLQRYHALRMNNTDKPLFMPLREFPKYKKLKKFSTLQVTPEKTGEEVITAALKIFDDAHCTKKLNSSNST
ncbi:hypothetical protein MMC30_009174 [Trapelia coarctata]|nr:hypothetical protein [Trapelia coarctata]